MSKRLSKPSLPEIQRTPPNALDLEEVVLGAVLLESKVAYAVFKIIRPEYFYVEKNRIVAEACKTLHDKNEPVDIVTVTNFLRDNKKIDEVGGAAYIAQLTNHVASTANTEYHCRIIQEKWMARELISQANQAIQSAYDGGDILDIIDQEQLVLHRMITGLGTNRDYSTDQLADQLAEIVAMNQEGKKPGVTTGCIKYDRITGGQQKGSLIIYAGRPGMGKSARMINEAYHQLKNGKKVVIHSIEMTGVECLARFTALETGIPVEEVMRSPIDKEKYARADKWIRTVPLKIFTDNKISDIERNTSIMVTSGKCDIAYVDYLQIVDSGSHNRYENVTKTSMSLKQMAKRLEIPVVALAQLSRAVEARGGSKIPQMADLKESGQIEQDADVVEFLYRPSYYGIEHDEQGNYCADQIWFINAKMRAGQPNQHCRMLWDGPTNRISNQEFLYFPDPKNKMPKSDDWGEYDGQDDESF